MRAYRRHYRDPAARRPPSVIQCDTLTSDTWWAGRLLGEHARHWTRLLTHGAGTLHFAGGRQCHAGGTRPRRGRLARRSEAGRGAASGSDFDRPYPHQTAFESLRAQRRLSAFHAAADNLVRAGMPLVEEISLHWDRWESGVLRLTPGGELRRPPALRYHGRDHGQAIHLGQLPAARLDGTRPAGREQRFSTHVPGCHVARRSPIGIAVQEVLEYHSIRTDHIAIRTSSYTGIDQQQKTVQGACGGLSRLAPVGRR